jgi:hypothetical protein
VQEQHAERRSVRWSLMCREHRRHYLAMRGLARAAMSVLLISSACRSNDLVLTLPSEAIDEGAVAYVVLIENVQSGQVEVAEARPVEGGLVRLTVDAASERRVRLLAYARDLEALDLSAGTLRPAPSELGTPLPRPESLWQAELGLDVPQWVRVQGLETSEIAFRVLAEPSDPCLVFEGAAQPWEITTLPLTNLLGVIALSEDRLLIGGHRYVDPPEGVLGFADFLKSYDPLPFALQNPELQDLERTGDRVFGVTRTELFELDIDTGHSIRSATVPPGRWALEIGVDETAVMFDAEAASAHWVELDTLSVRPVEAPVELRAMFVVSSALVFGGRDNEIYVFDGQSWSLEARLPTTEIFEFFGDGLQVGALYDGVTVYLRDANARWTAMPRSAGGLAVLLHGAFMADGRILVAGDGGFTVGWTGEKWCDILTGIQRESRGIAVTSDRQTAFIHSFAENMVQRAPLIRIQPRRMH